MAVGLALALQIAFIPRGRGEDHVDYRYESYLEDDNRIQVQTHAVLFDMTLKEGLLAVKGQLVHDAVSGATPYGAPPPSKLDYGYQTWLADQFGIPFDALVTGNTNNSSVLLSHMHDERKSVSLELPVTLGMHEVTPQFSYSEESDYKSTGAALNYSVQLNEKNTTLTFGWAHTWDRVRDTLLVIHDKSSNDYLIGVNQLLGPKTVLGVNFTYGEANGYLDDPYRTIVGVLDPQFDVSGNQPLSGGTEKRPDYRDKVIGRVSLTQYITPANASVEAAYRFYHDTFEINAHTVDLAWYQKIGKHVVVSPNFRYYHQTAASFYYEMLPGNAFFSDPSHPGNMPIPLPNYYSPDYRLSELQSLTFGVNVTVKATKWLTFDAGYKRYIMEGLDGVTSATAYPSANVFTVGARFIF